jgi:alanyl-tRNA synthetase
VTEHLKIDLDRLWVSVFAGDPELGLAEDKDAIRLWKQIGMPPDRIVRLGREHNFWSVGGPGPCGPDTELFYDRGENLGCGRPECAPGCECERFLEFWNLVFMEYELHPDGSVTPLPKQNVDTGLGLERTAAIQQGVISVYETDGYQAIMDWIEAESGVGWQSSDKATKAHRIMADHGRGMTFLVADGVLPSNEGRGYVLRRVIRRAVQQARGIDLADLWRISDVVADQMSTWYLELDENRERIRETLRAEEERFSQTLERGLGLFEEIASGDFISGEDAFKLHDTYGFPLELTRELAGERGLAVDEEEFSRLMAEQRARSKTKTAEVAIVVDGSRPTEFVGYESTEVLTAILAYEDLEDGTFQAKLERSPFYPEGGGQVSDLGFIENEETGARANLIRATRVGDDQVLTFEGEGFAEGDRVRAVVPWSVRFPTMANHTATHLLHQALRDVLGDQVRQAGSAVRPDKLRFDFTYDKALTPEEREQVERAVNEKIFQNLPVRTFVTPIDEARRLGAMMLFGEKYGDEVRVVEIDDYSRELCGGTHVRSTAEIGPFVILSEASVGSGARRIEAVTAGEAWSWLRARAEEAEELRAEVQQLRKGAGRKPAAAELEVNYRDETNGIVVAEVEALKGSDLKDLSDRIRQSRQAAAVLLGSVDEGRAYLVVNLDRSLVDQGIDAVKVARKAAEKIGGGGGGRADLAEAGGKNPEGLAEAYEVAKSEIASALE